MPEVRTGVGPGCTRSLGESAVRLVLEEVAASNWAFSACAEHSSVLTYFLYYIGQSPLRMWEGELKGERRGGAGEFYCTDEGEESGDSFSFFPWKRAMASPCLPGGGRRRRELTVVLSSEQAQEGRMRLYSSCIPSWRSAMVHLRWLPLEFLWYCHWNGEHYAVYGQCSGCRLEGVKNVESSSWTACCWRVGWA